MRGLARSRGGGNGGKREPCCRHRQRTATPPPAVRWTGESAPRRSSHWHWSGQRRCGAARFAVGACTQRGRTPHPQRASVVDPRAAAAAGAPRPLLLTSRRQSPLDSCPRASVLAAHSVHASPPPRSLCTLPYDAAAGRTGSSQPAMKVLAALASARELPAQTSTASPFRRGQSKDPRTGAPSARCARMCSRAASTVVVGVDCPVRGGRLHPSSSVRLATCSTRGANIHDGGRERPLVLTPPGPWLR